MLIDAPPPLCLRDRRRLAQFGILEFYRLSLYLETLSLLRVRESFQDVTRAKLPAKHHI